MKENIVDFNQFKAMKESKSKNNVDDFLPDFPDDLDEYDEEPTDNLMGAITGLFSRIMSEASEYETFNDYVKALEENLKDLKADEPRSKKSRKFFAWLSQLVNEEMTFHLAQSIAQVVQAGKEAIEPKIPLLMHGKIPESGLGVKLPLETSDDVMAVNARVEEIMRLEHDGKATEADVDAKTTLLAILVMISRQLMQEYAAEEPRKARKSHHRKWEDKIQSVRYNLNSFYYLAGTSYSDVLKTTDISENTSLDQLLENNLGLDIDDDEYSSLTIDDISDFISALIENGGLDDSYEDYDDDDDYEDDDYDDDDDDVDFYFNDIDDDDDDD